jgi:putative transposase
MKKHNEETIIKILQEAEGDITVRDVCRKHQITEQTFYRWRNKYGGMDVSDARRLKNIERENVQLKQVVAELTLDNRILTDVNKKKW